jgi:hypothetical protein
MPRYPDTHATMKVETATCPAGEPQEGNDIREDERLCEWRSTLKGGNPMGGTSMKQGWQVAGGKRP